MNCPKCRTEIPEKFRFCPECGTAVSSESRKSGVEADLSLGGLQTMAPAPADADRSLGDLKTMAGQTGAEKVSGSEGPPLDERYDAMTVLWEPVDRPPKTARNQMIGCALQ